jgi:hypothetical protein
VKFRHRAAILAIPLVSVVPLRMQHDSDRAIITRRDVPDERYRLLASRPEYAAIGAIVRRDSTGAGTGELIAPRWVITAAHVVRSAGPDEIQVRFHNRVVRVRQVVVHPRYASPSAGSGLDRSAFDVALLELRDTAPIPPLPVEFALPERGELATLVGFGAGGPDGRDPAGTKRAARNRVDQVGGTYRGNAVPDHIVLLDFDGPTASRNAVGSGEPDALEGIASGGDSGGALLVDRGGRPTLVATFAASRVDLASAVSRDFSGTLNVFVGLAPHREWIEGVLNGSSAPPQIGRPRAEGP